MLPIVRYVLPLTSVLYVMELILSIVMDNVYYVKHHVPLAIQMVLATHVPNLSTLHHHQLDNVSCVKIPSAKHVQPHQIPIV